MADTDPVNLPPAGKRRESVNHTTPKHHSDSENSGLSTVPNTPSRYYNYLDELPDTQSPGSVMEHEEEAR